MQWQPHTGAMTVRGTELAMLVGLSSEMVWLFYTLTSS